jgi:hypothetical protein
VDQSSLDAVQKYIANQKEHHQQRGFKGEFLLLLRRHRLEDDEIFVGLVPHLWCSMDYLGSHT